VTGPSCAGSYCVAESVEGGETGGERERRGGERRQTNSRPEKGWEIAHFEGQWQLSGTAFCLPHLKPYMLSCLWKLVKLLWNRRGVGVEIYVRIGGRFRTGRWYLPCLRPSPVPEVLWEDAFYKLLLVPDDESGAARVVLLRIPAQDRGVPLLRATGGFALFFNNLVSAEDGG
jgi:hypothetical protein